MGVDFLKKYTWIVVYSFFRPKMPWLFATFAELPSLTLRSPSPCPEAEWWWRFADDSFVHVFSPYFLLLSVCLDAQVKVNGGVSLICVLSSTLVCTNTNILKSNHSHGRHGKNGWLRSRRAQNTGHFLQPHAGFDPTMVYTTFLLFWLSILNFVPGSCSPTYTTGCWPLFHFLPIQCDMFASDFFRDHTDRKAAPLAWTKSQLQIMEADAKQIAVVNKCENLKSFGQCTHCMQCFSWLMYKTCTTCKNAKIIKQSWTQWKWVGKYKRSKINKSPLLWFEDPLSDRSVARAARALSCRLGSLASTRDFLRLENVTPCDNIPLISNIPTFQ